MGLSNEISFILIFLAVPVQQVFKVLKTCCTKIPVHQCMIYDLWVGWYTKGLSFENDCPFTMKPATFAGKLRTVTELLGSWPSESKQKKIGDF